MRLASFECLKLVLAQQGKNLADYEDVLEVGGSTIVSLRGKWGTKVAPNPLINEKKGIVLLDKGFNNDTFGAFTTKILDFLDENAIKEIKSSFDFVISLDTLEHVEDPHVFFEHILSTLRPGGVAWISTVFMFPYHPSPADYWRFSPAALLLLLSKHTDAKCIWSGWENDGIGTGILFQKAPFTMEEVIFPQKEKSLLSFLVSEVGNRINGRFNRITQFKSLE